MIYHLSINGNYVILRWILAYYRPMKQWEYEKSKKYYYMNFGYSISDILTTINNLRNIQRVCITYFVIKNSKYSDFKLSYLFTISSENRDFSALEKDWLGALLYLAS